MDKQKQLSKKIKSKKDMKKYVIAITMMLALGLSAGAASQSHRHTPRTEQADSTQTKDAVEAYSDTTSVADEESTQEEEYTTTHRSRTVTYSGDDKDALLDLVGGLLGSTVAIGVVGIVVIFLLAPLLIIIAIFYFVNRNRRDKYRLAEMAIKNGQPIPDQILNDKQTEWDKNDYQSGIRQMFTGIGLAIFLGFAAGKFGFGIGALVFFIGLGKWFIARQSGNNLNNNSNNIQNYD